MSSATVERQTKQVFWARAALLAALQAGLMWPLVEVGGVGLVGVVGVVVAGVAAVAASAGSGSEQVVHVAQREGSAATLAKRPLRRRAKRKKAMAKRDVPLGLPTWPTGELSASQATHCAELDCEHGSGSHKPQAVSKSFPVSLEHCTQSAEAAWHGLMPMMTARPSVLPSNRDLAYPALAKLVISVKLENMKMTVPPRWSLCERCCWN